MSRGAGIESISPAEIRVAANGHARVRVVGRGYGRLRVGRHRRWIWGAFDESVRVELGADAREVPIVLRGFGGAKRRIPVRLASDLQTPRVNGRIRSFRSEVFVPHSRGVITHRITAPYLLSLVHVAPEPAVSENEPTP